MSKQPKRQGEHFHIRLPYEVAEAVDRYREARGNISKRIAVQLLVIDALVKAGYWLEKGKLSDG